LSRFGHAPERMPLWWRKMVELPDTARNQFKSVFGLFHCGIEGIKLVFLFEEI
jgi:hypothetical protein